MYYENTEGKFLIMKLGPSALINNQGIYSCWPNFSNSLCCVVLTNTTDVNVTCIGKLIVPAFYIPDKVVGNMYNFTWNIIIMRFNGLNWLDFTVACDLLDM